MLLAKNTKVLTESIAVSKLIYIYTDGYSYCGIYKQSCIDQNKY